jgi:hypothetical protein
MTAIKEIPFSGIRKGDTIRVTETFPSGFKSVSEGVAETYQAGFERWLTPSESSGDPHLILTAKNPMHGAIRNIELLDRPTPPLPQEYGTVIRITAYKNGYNSRVRRTTLAILDHDGDWAAWSFPESVGVDYLKPSEIIEWNPVTIVDLERTEA